MGGFDKIELTPKNTSTATNSSAQGRDGGKGEFKSDRKAKGSPDFAKAETGKTFMTDRKKGRKIKVGKRYPIALSIIALILLLIGIPAYATYKSGLKTYREAKLVAAALKSQNIELASSEIDKTKIELAATQKNFHYLIPLKFVPVVNWYYNDLDHLLNAGQYGLDTATVTVNSIKPYADVLGLKGQGSFTAGSTEDRIKTAVLTIGKITPQIDKISVSFEQVKKEVDQVDPGHYPTFLFGKTPKEKLSTIRDFADGGVTFVTQAKPLVKVLPSLLGETEAKKYLVIFQNDKELRPTGGFITAYAVFTIDKGIIKLEKSEDIYSLDDSVPNKPKAPAPILKYLPKVYTFNLRDSNLSPDFIESMKTFRSMYETASQRTKVDGIVAIDTSVLVSTIKILDDSVSAGGITFSSKNDVKCDCPQAIYELENNISRPVNYVKTERKGLIGDLISAIMVKALTSSPKKYWGPLFQSFITQTNQKHILAYLYDDGAQQGIEALNAAGRIRSFDGDYLHINEANFSGAKVNIFMQEQVDNDYEIKNGEITKTVTIHYKNPFPPSDCNLERGGLCLNAEYRDWFRVYVPKGSVLVDSKGSQVKITTSEDLGKTVFEGFLTVRPKGIGTFTITYKLPFKLKDGSPLPVMIQKQPGTNSNIYNNIVNGRTVETFPLETDKEVKLKI
ncbi:MAG TPA: DUF4012 domain-containing protein [Candidatus Saccharimonadales bacterium]|nr:DUF4012 domain-containing protein [Candidatus Saccharimonadales bacterium]